MASRGQEEPFNFRLALAVLWSAQGVAPEVLTKLVFIRNNGGRQIYQFHTYSLQPTVPKSSIFQLLNRRNHFWFFYRSIAMSFILNALQFNMFYLLSWSTKRRCSDFIRSYYNPLYKSTAREIILFSVGHVHTWEQHCNLHQPVKISQRILSSIPKCRNRPNK